MFVAAPGQGAYIDPSRRFGYTMEPPLTAGGSSLVTTAMDWSSFVNSTRTTTTSFNNFDATGDSQLGVSNVSVLLAQDGRWETTLRGTPTLAMLIAQATNTAHDLTADSIYGAQWVNGAGSSKNIISGAGNGNMNRTLSTQSAVTNDIGIIEFAGDQVMLKYRPVVTQGQYLAGNEYVMHRFAAARTQTLFPGGRFFGTPNGLGQLKQIIGSLLRKWGAANVNIVLCGNSLFQDDGSSNLITQLSDAYPWVGRGVTVTNLSANAATWQIMTATQAANAKAAFNGAKKNILLTWETTNTILAGGTSASNLTDAQAFFTAVTAATAWDAIFTAETIPREGGWANQAAMTTGNGVMKAADTNLEQNLGSFNGQTPQFIRLRPGTVLDMTTYISPGDFDATGAIWQEAAGSRIHLNAFGDYIVTPKWQAKLLTLAY